MVWLSAHPHVRHVACGLGGILMLVNRKHKMKRGPREILTRRVMPSEASANATGQQTSLHSAAWFKGGVGGRVDRHADGPK